MKPPSILSAAKDLRETQTDAERKLWTFLRGKRFEGFKFKRQQPIDRFVVDFCCLRGKLVLELDGSQHMDQESQDNERTQYLETIGFRVLRFWNHDVLERTSLVLEQIRKALTEPSPALRASSPEKGEGNP